MVRKSFDEFRGKKVDTTQESTKSLEATIKDSYTILSDFNPQVGG